MAEEKMVLEINEEGEISVDLDGFKGKGCAAIMDLLEETIGPAERENKPEYDARTAVKGKSNVKVKTGT
jgi:hypothetical protein